MRVVYNAIKSIGKERRLRIGIIGKRELYRGININYM